MWNKNSFVLSWSYMGVSRFICLLYFLRIATGLKFQLELPASTVFETPQDGDPVVADFRNETQDFFFGIAIAPAQSEDSLNDSWIDWARKGKVFAFDNVAHPEDRLWFWSDPGLSLDLIQNAGVQMVRLGIDWARLTPSKPKSFGPENAILDTQSLEQYKKLFWEVKYKRNMRIMLTLFHHSLPNWAHDLGGWMEKSVADYFIDFATRVYDEMHTVVDYWITFNEPTIFNLLTYCAKIWPHSDVQNASLFQQLHCLEPKFGAYHIATKNIAYAHNKLVRIAKAKPRQLGSFEPKFSIAHNVGIQVPSSIWDFPSAKLFPFLFTYPIYDAIIQNCDFIGINYYGKELISGSSVAILDDVEYSESGRAISPESLYKILVDFHNRYNIQKKGRSHFSKEGLLTDIPFVVTENGISDGSDLLRPAYTIEHLMAVRGAMDSGVPVIGFIEWTILDNWEWVDGYCPKFGLIGVNREEKKLIVRPSYSLFRSISSLKFITQGQRELAWERIQNARLNGIKRPFCRATDGKTSLDSPVWRNISKINWRFQIPSIKD